MASVAEGQDHPPNRGAYETDACLIGGCAEALALRGDRLEAGRLLAKAEADWPRHTAFRGEFQRLVRASPLLPNPPKPRKR